jgi:hypothetical protein
MFTFQITSNRYFRHTKRSPKGGLERTGQAKRRVPETFKHLGFQRGHQARPLRPAHLLEFGADSSADRSGRTQATIAQQDSSSVGADAIESGLERPRRNAQLSDNVIHECSKTHDHSDRRATGRHDIASAARLDR